MKIKSARITPQRLRSPVTTCDIYVILENGLEQLLFWYYPDELNFAPSELVGLTVDEAHGLKHKKDVAYLRS